MIEWTAQDVSYTAFYNNKIVAYTTYTGEDKVKPHAFCAVILTQDGYLFVLGYLPDLALAKNVCEIGYNEGKDWQWWLENLNKWWYENVSQV